MDYAFLALAIPVVLLVGISKGGFAGGLGLLAVPLLTLLVDPRKAAAVMLPILCCMDLFAAWEYRRCWDKRNLITLIPAALLGIVIGTLSFKYMNAELIRLMIGVVALYFVGHYWFVQRRQSQSPTGTSVYRGSFWGAIAGFTSFVAHAGGPPLSVYLLSQRLDKRLLVGTSVMFFLVVNYVKLIPYAWLGQLSSGNLMLSLILLPLAPIGIKLGVWLNKRVSQQIFYVICYATLSLVGVKLVVESVLSMLP